MDTPKQFLPIRQAMRLLASWEPLSRLPYAVAMLALLLVKLWADHILYLQATGTPVFDLRLLTPLYEYRVAAGGRLPGRLQFCLLFYSFVLFVLVLVFTIRRLRHAQLPAECALLLFLPFVNYLFVVVMCGVGSPGTWEAPPWTKRSASRAVLIGVLAGGAFGLLASAFLIYRSESYGLALFLGVPFIASFITGLCANLKKPRSAGETIRICQLSLLCLAGMLLLFALEGIICIAMAYPIVAAVSIIGGEFGRQVALGCQMRPSGLFALILSLPLLGTMEAVQWEPPLRQVSTTIEVAAPPEVVWENVVAFTELPPNKEWLFRLGIACPLKATIDGEGVGAVRHCVFTTGPFVEPITHWEPPHRLAFDVTSQPPPMEEWSPYQTVHAPHLIDGLQSKRGEFRLSALPGGGTRLEGTTWYTVDMAPQFYWARWSDYIIHRIHTRVLGHIKSQAEAKLQIR